LDWAVDGRDWPHRNASRFVEAGGLRWHIQVSGQGPALLLLHGAGAATHSWRSLAPMLADKFTVVALDLPGHGFTESPALGADFALPRVAQSVAALLRELDVAPRALLGHSAGAAIAVRLSLDGVAPTADIVGVNAALLPFPGPLGPWAPVLTRTVFYNRLALRLFARRAAQPGAIAKLMASTGSALDPRSLELYERLFRSESHLEATIALMSHWDLSALKQHLRYVHAPMTLIVGDKDRAVSPSAAWEVQRSIRHARIAVARGLGHLAHEEDAGAVAQLVLSALQHAR
jgi:magnesium chelatase accessory protein